MHSSTPVRLLLVVVRIEDKNYISFFLLGDLVIGLLYSINILSKNSRDFWSRCWNDASYLLLSFVFFFTPGFLTQYGCVAVAYAYPAYASTVALAMEDDQLNK